MVRLTDSECAMLRSQSGPLAGVPLSTTPSNTLSPNRFTLVPGSLVPPLALAPSSLSARQCRCGRPLDALAITLLHVPEQGSWGSAGARICREAGRQSRGERSVPRL